VDVESVEQSSTMMISYVREGFVRKCSTASTSIGLRRRDSLNAGTTTDSATDGGVLEAGSGFGVVGANAER